MAPKKTLGQCNSSKLIRYIKQNPQKQTNPIFSSDSFDDRISEAEIVPLPKNIAIHDFLDCSTASK